jgi:thioesterase domain-containing protein
VLERVSGSQSLVRLRAGKGRPAVFLVHDADGEVLLYRNLALRLHPDHAVYGIQPRLDEHQTVLHTRMADMVNHYIECIRGVQPEGPYVLAGLCAGGAIAFEIARRLQDQGEKIATLAMFDAVDIRAQPKLAYPMRKRMERLAQSFRTRAQRSLWFAIGMAVPDLLGGAKGYVVYKVASTLAQIMVRAKVRMLSYFLDHQSAPPANVRALTVREVLSSSEQALADTGRLRGEVALFRATRSLQGESDEPFLQRYRDPLFGWQRRVDGRITAYDMPGGHSSMLQEPQVEALARQLQACVDERLLTPA